MFLQISSRCYPHLLHKLMYDRVIIIKIIVFAAHERSCTYTFSSLGASSNGLTVIFACKKLDAHLASTCCRGCDVVRSRSCSSQQHVSRTYLINQLRVINYATVSGDAYIFCDVVTAAITYTILSTKSAWKCLLQDKASIRLLKISDCACPWRSDASVAAVKVPNTQ